MTENKTPRILIVDDNPQNLQVLAGILSERKYEIALAKSGAQALDFLETDSPDLILLDIMMPEMNGYEVCEKLKSNERTKDIPVIFLTARIGEEAIIKGFEAGAVDYVIKPFNTAELLARINTHIELKRAREEIKTLHGLIPVCANCKDIRDDQGEWKQIEAYVRDHTEADFSHSICPKCMLELYGEEFGAKKP